MTDNARIPIVIGVTGHRNIRKQDEDAIRAAVEGELQKLQALCPHSPFVLLCSLAEGGDLLCADAAEKLGIPLIAVLPRERADYERDFSEAGKACFSHHCARADQLFVAPRTEALPTEGESRAYQFCHTAVDDGKLLMVPLLDIEATRDKRAALSYDRSS